MSQLGAIVISRKTPACWSPHFAIEAPICAVFIPDLVGAVYAVGLVAAHLYDPNFIY